MQILTSVVFSLLILAVVGNAALTAQDVPKSSRVWAAQWVRQLSAAGGHVHASLASLDSALEGPQQLQQFLWNKTYGAALLLGGLFGSPEDEPQPLSFPLEDAEGPGVWERLMAGHTELMTSVSTTGQRQRAQAKVDGFAAGVETSAPKRREGQRERSTATVLTGKPRGCAGQSRRQLLAVYEPADKAKYLPLGYPRSYCTNGALAVPNTPAAAMFVCNTTGSPANATLAQYLGYTELQKAACNVSIASLQCVCPSDAQLTRDLTGGNEYCRFRQLSCDVAITYPQKACTAKRDIAQPKVLSPGCYTSSRRNMNMTMKFKLTCSLRQESNGSLASSNLILPAVSSTASLVPLVHKPFFLSSGAVSNNSLLTAPAGTYAQLVNTAFSYPNATSANALNISSDNPTTFTLFSQWYDFDRISNQSTRWTSSLPTTTVVPYLNGQTELTRAFNLSPLTDGYFSGGRLYGEVGIRGTNVVLSVAQIWLDISDPPPGRYRKPKVPVPIAMIGGLLIILVIIFAAVVYCIRQHRQSRDRMENFRSADAEARASLRKRRTTTSAE